MEGRGGWRGEGSTHGVVAHVRCCIGHGITRADHHGAEKRCIKGDKNNAASMFVVHVTQGWYIFVCAEARVAVCGLFPALLKDG